MRKKPTRSYSQRTIKILFGQSGNQCAQPDCTNPLIVPGTEYSDAHVSAQISHIFPASDAGPRAAGKRPRNRNEADNLILLCPTHHGIIDGQYETYPSDLLRRWKQEHESKYAVQPSLGSLRLSAGQPGAAYLEAEIEQLELTLRRTRFYTDGRTAERATQLGQRVMRGDLAAASSRVRAHALGWCARTLIFGPARTTAQEFLLFAETLAHTEPVEFARAFEQLAQGDKAGAMQRLSRRTSPAARTALFMIAVHSEDTASSLAWFENSRLAFSDLDADGKFALMSRYLQAERWEDVSRLAAALTESDFADLPALLHQAALAHFLPSVPLDLRRLVISQPPFDLTEFPLSSDTHEIERRRIAANLFERAAEAAEALDSRNARSVSSFYARWLELRDPDTRARARERLQESLRDPDTALGFVPLAGPFGIPLDIAAVEREIARRVSLAGYKDIEAATARFALAFAQPDPASAAAYLDRHRPELVELLDPVAILSIEIELLTKAGRGDQALSRLEGAPPELLSPDQRAKLQLMIGQGQRDPDIEQAEQTFEERNSTPALAQLVTALEARHTDPKFLKYARLLFERTRALPDAERLARLLASLQMNQELIDFLDAEAALVGQSLALRATRAWTLYRSGRLREAREEIEAVRAQRSDPNDRMLAINLALTSGEWEAVAGLLEEEWRDRATKTPTQLLWSANLAGLLGLARKRDFLFLAAASAPADAEILAGAYFMASQFGFDGDEEVTGWLVRAAALSGDDGPIQSMSLAELIERKPAWDRREEDTWDKVRAAEIPLFLAGQLLHRSLLDLQLRPMIHNAQAADPRRRIVVPLFSGVRRPGGVQPKAIALDASSLLTLAYLELVPAALEGLKRVVVPHSTLTWLLDERKRAVFHQPTRVTAAHGLRALLAGGKLSIFAAGRAADPDLADEIGQDLAEMLEAARPTGGEAGPQRLVVRSSPVRRVGSLTDEEADLSRYSDRYCSCLALVEKLLVRGKLSRIEHQRAKAYLGFQERARTDEPAIEDGAELLLDDLSVSYLDHLGLLGRLADAGFTTRIAQREAADADNLIAYEVNAGHVIATLDRLRTELAAGIADGRIEVGSLGGRTNGDDDDLRSHPTYGVMALADDVDAIAIDDRALNRHTRVDGRESNAEIWNTVDLIDYLHANGHLEREVWLDSRARLRRAGAIFVPVNQDEFTELLESATVTNGVLHESAELQAIRENILLARMGPWLQLPAELPWFDQFISAVARALRACWKEEEVAAAAARSHWLLSFLDLRDWGSRFEEAVASNVARYGYGMGLQPLLMVSDDLNAGQFKHFQTWLTEEVLQPLENENPEIFDWLVERVRDVVNSLVEGVDTRALS
jgi:hypothetical protein